MQPSTETIDAGEAVARIAYQVSDIVAIYPITPASPMGEYADQWAAEGRPNLWGLVPSITEMQSEAGAAGAVHGALQAGALATTFTASQGLLLMLPNMFKIAGELTPAVFHIAARSVATHALSIFCDHSDVMAVRGAGWAMLASSSVQEAADLALVAHAATLAARVPFLHFFDGFRTSHEIQKINLPTTEAVRALIDERHVADHRRRALTPDRPVIRGTSQNPDVFFQSREAVNPHYLACPAIVQQAMDDLAQHTGRHYKLCDYVGAVDARCVIVALGSATQTIEETVDHLTAAGQPVGLVKCRLYRPFPTDAFLASLPATVETVVVLDRTKEPGSAGEPLYLDVLAALKTTDAHSAARVLSGRYGLGSKEFTPAMVKAVFDEAAGAHPKHRFTVGIVDDVTHTSLDYDPTFSVEHDDVTRAVFFGLGSDGTVGANKNSIKIISEHTNYHVQGYFQYDSKKAGSMTVSHLRFGQRPIRSAYLIDRATFVACHQEALLERTDIIRFAEPRATLLLNCPHAAATAWGHLPHEVQQGIIDKQLKLWVIDAEGLAREMGLGGRVSTIMQTCFFALTGVLPRDEALEAIRQSVVKTYGKRGQVVIDRNLAAIDQAVAGLHPVKVPDTANGAPRRRAPIPDTAPEFVRNVTARLIAGQGDALPVSALPLDGTYPSGTSRWEGRGIAHEVPVWDADVCIQCGKCVAVCPHAVIRAKLCSPERLVDSPDDFVAAAARWPEAGGQRYTLQVSPDDCTGCGLCVAACPARNKSVARLKALNMAPYVEHRDSQQRHWQYFTQLPETARDALRLDHIKDIQLAQPLFEFSGACAGCGETPYLKLLTQLFGDRMLVANATGCSSIYGGNLPTTPWTHNAQGRGPAWSNSLFEDNAEFGLGMRLAADHRRARAEQLLEHLAPQLDPGLAQGLLSTDQSIEAGLTEQRRLVERLKTAVATINDSAAEELHLLADDLVRRSVWIIGGDGWAYDIGFGGLDHVLASGEDVNVLVLDTEVYSNTGGQMSKSTPRGAVAKFAAGGKRLPKKDLAMMAMSYGHVYVARIALGANDAQTLRALIEAESYPGPSLVIAYSQCIAHGYDLVHGLDQQRLAVATGYWPLIRYDPRRVEQGLPPLVLDNKPPSQSLSKYMYNEGRFTILRQAQPEAAAELLAIAEHDIRQRWRSYEHWARMPVDGTPKPAATESPA